MEDPSVVRWVIAFGGLFASLALAMLTWIAIRVEQQHRRDTRSEARRVAFDERLQGRRDLAAAVSNLSPAARRQVEDADEVLRISRR